MGRSSISVRGLAAVTAACALLWIGAASATAAPLLYSANPTQDSVSVINPATGQVVGEPIQVGDVPFSIALTPDGNSAYVANRFANTVSVIDTTTRKTVGKPIPVGEDPIQASVTPDGLSAWVTDESSEDLTVIDTRSDQVARTIETEGRPYGVAFTPDGRYAYVALEEEEAVEVIEAQTGRSLGQIPTGNTPFTVTFTPDGSKALVANFEGKSLTVIDAATRRAIGTIPVGLRPSAVAISPDGKKAYVANSGDGTVSAIDLATDEAVATIPVGESPGEVAIAPNGKTLYVAVEGSGEIVAVDLATNAPLGVPILVPGTRALAVSADVSPSAVFTAPEAIAGTPVAFSGAASSDPDGTVVNWNWAFGDGATGSGVSVSYTYGQAGDFGAKLSIIDNEGCGEAQVFTGRAFYCSGGGLTAVHPVTVKAPPVEPIAAPAPPSDNFRFGRIVHNLRNGTVRVQVKLPSAGFVLLFGKKVHAVTRKSKGVQSMWLTLHARVRLAKQLKKTLRAPVKFRVTFTPNGGTPKTAHRSVTLQRAPRGKHGSGH
jgi:YVTN family beta-propeller protein